jgi:hypothetical protein
MMRMNIGPCPPHTLVVGIGLADVGDVLETKSGSGVERGEPVISGIGVHVGGIPNGVGLTC